MESARANERTSVYAVLIVVGLVTAAVFTMAGTLADLAGMRSTTT
ncbi:hypothetical protein ACIQUM_14965 [Amycolatopsis azurea]